MEKKYIKVTVQVIILLTMAMVGIGMNEFIKSYLVNMEKLNTTIEQQTTKISELESAISGMEKENITLTNTLSKLEHDILLLNDEIDKVKKDVKNKSYTTKKSTTSKSSDNTKSSGKTMTFEATAYSGDPITATGTVPQVGRTIAVDPKVIPYGTKVKIKGFDGVFTAEDCGGAIKGNIIDIFMGSKQECYDWGRRKVEIEIL